MSNKDSRFVDPPNSLRQKIGGDTGPIKIDSETMEQAQSVIDKHAESYVETVQAEIQTLTETFKQAEDDPAGRAAHLESVADQVHEIRGMGGTYDFPLITKIGSSLYDFCQSAEGTPSQMEVIKAHIDALRVIVSQNIKGDGGTVGEQLLTGLRTAASKHLSKKDT